MSGTALLTAIIEILVGGISGVATGIGAGLSTLATSIFLTGEGNAQTLSTFGVLIVCFAGISLAIGLCRFCLTWATLKHGKNLEHFNMNQNGSLVLTY